MEPKLMAARGPVNWTGSSETSPSSSLRLLGPAADGDDLMASRAVLPLVNAAGGFDGYTISGNGKVVVGTVSGPRTGVVDGARVAVGSVVAFSAGTRTPSVRYRPPLPAKGQTGKRSWPRYSRGL
jgi:hypothetical protein